MRRQLSIILQYTMAKLITCRGGVDALIECLLGFTAMCCRRTRARRLCSTRCFSMISLTGRGCSRLPQGREMAKEFFEHFNLRQTSLDLIAQVNAVLSRYEAMGYRLTL